MNAREITAKWERAGCTPGAAYTLSAECVRHVATTVEARGSSAAALVGALDEADAIWRAFAKRAPGVDPGGFANAILEQLPEIGAVWRQYRELVR